jgi:hypothetical protein
MRKFVVFSILMVGLSGVYLWSQQWQQVAVLKNEVGKGESVLMVEWVSPGSVGKTIMVEDRDGGAQATSIIRHIYGGNIVLKETLGRFFPTGSRVYQ